MYDKNYLEALCRKQRREISITRGLINKAKIDTVCTMLVTRDAEAIGKHQDFLRDLSVKERMIDEFERNVEHAERFLKTL